MFYLKQEFFSDCVVKKYIMKIFETDLTSEQIELNHDLYACKNVLLI